MARDDPKFMLRLPDGWRDRIAEAAKANNRSMNAEIVARLIRTFAQDDVHEHLDKAADEFIQRHMEKVDKAFGPPAKD